MKVINTRKRSEPPTAQGEKVIHVATRETQSQVVGIPAETVAAVAEFPGSETESSSKVVSAECD